MAVATVAGDYRGCPLTRPLCRFSGDLSGDRHAEAGHAVDHLAGDAGIDLLGRQIPCWGASSDAGRGRDRSYLLPPAQIPACGFPAPGSCRRSDATGIRGLGSSSDPWAQAVGNMPVPALCPGHALALALPSTGRLPSTLSATSLSAGVVRGFIGTLQPPHAFPSSVIHRTSCRGPGSPWRLRAALPGSDTIRDGSNGSPAESSHDGPAPVACGGL